MIDGRAWKFFPIGLIARGNAVTILLKLMICLSNSNRSVYEPHCKRKEKMSLEELLGVLARLHLRPHTCACLPILCTVCPTIWTRPTYLVIEVSSTLHFSTYDLGSSRELCVYYVLGASPIHNVSIDFLLYLEYLYLCRWLLLYVCSLLPYFPS